ncbi:MAG: aminoacyl-histidine dipeptidase [Bacteroidaceae bacterium]|nr:aminoacyl-histidine dipeptidase [Prevotellaceae bacterium]MDY2849734.1 aminoacyl-histidine dipeptidase [Bacteroidaceae bacterium]
MDITQLSPKGIWKNFHALTQVPRPSGHLEKIQEYLLSWAQSHGFESFKDNAGNIIMRKEAAPGYENRPMVTMEAHMDMVPQKTHESTHNFLTDPIETYIDGEWVKAKGTTLGSDDGIGVATAMAVFEDRELKHGPLEAIFTVDEETCMHGVNNLKADTLKGQILLNLDNETEGEFVIGSASGVDVAAELTYTPEAVSADKKAVKIAVSGLKGGHSGLEINEGRANANKLLANIAKELLGAGYTLASWEGGDMRNAIPSRGNIVVAAPADKVAEVKTTVSKWEKIYQSEYNGIEDGLQVSATDTDTPSEAVPMTVAQNITKAVLATAVGPYRFIPHMPSIVETSCNLGIVVVGNGKAEADVLVRSSCDSKLDELASSIASAFELGGFSVEYKGKYPAWQPDFDSPLVAKLQKVYKDVNGEDCKVTVCHAGLECGIIKTIYPDMDAVSFGPTLRSPHTPNERCNIPSVEKYYKFVIKLLENI